MTEGNNRLALYTDEELMGMICAGEVLAFDEIYARYSKRLLVYFTRMLNFDKNKAEDALQDIFLKLAEAPQKFDRNRSFKTWIFSVASNCCKNYFRHQKVVKKSENDLVHLYKQALDSNFIESVHKLDTILFEKMLDSILLELSPEKKEAFILKYQEDKSIAEIAEIQNCPKGSVKSRLHYTLKILEQKLKSFNPIYS